MLFVALSQLMPVLAMPSIRAQAAPPGTTETFPLSYHLNMADVSSTSQIRDQGWVFADGWQVGAEFEGRNSVGTPSNIRLNHGVLELVVPGGQRGSSYTAAEMSWGGDQGVTGGYFEMVAKIDNSKGTCQSIFTYHLWHEDESRNTGDEQDIEFIPADLTDTGRGITRVELTNWDPAPVSENDRKSDFNMVTVNQDLTQDYHAYGIGWYKDGVKYFLDGMEIHGPAKYTSINPSNIIINHWTNSDPNFTAGPPRQDTILRVKSISFQYKK